ncbi:SAF domain-containing protein [Lentzea sp. HUAS12]|uniref:SAF domain-containing protein n=1 Tax=Lentzea sp. HUAS12 TaxID=2951806 RepID=UPI0020A214AF|nr:SAF domain-containing protein [Lentzea sp. HUAS12]USX56435.1 SAF domain-containing protein [Lentzea sp. HUAS12]
MQTTVTGDDTTSSSTTNSSAWMSGKTRSLSRLRGRRRSRPYLVLGLLLPALCSGVFLWISLKNDDTRPVLATAREVAVGHVLTSADLRPVHLAVDADVLVVDASRADGVVGKTLSVSLPAGALLTPDAVNAPAIPAAGQAIVSLALKAGQLPVEVRSGARVNVVAGAASAPLAQASASDRGATWPGVVTSVTTSAGEQVSVVSVQLSESAAREVAAAPVGQVSLVLVAGGGR